MNKKELILNFPREIKIQTLRDALKQNKLNIYLGLTTILLNAPINKGGLESEIIEQIFTEYLNNNKVKPI